MTANVFAYGTLMFPAIVEALIGRVSKMRNARLDGYRRCAVEDQSRVAKGPMIIAQQGSFVFGKVLLDLDAREEGIIDLFEGAAEGYEISCASVTTLDDGGQVVAKFYVASERLRPYLSHRDWSEADFEQHYLESYLSKRIPELKASWRLSGKM